MRILHASDLHVANPPSDRDLLAATAYQSYLGRLADRIRSLSPGKIDVLAITGDFVEQGATVLFHDHIPTVVNYLCQELGVHKDAVYMCPGNHDIERAHDVAGCPDGARAAYLEFAHGFGNAKDPVLSTDRFHCFAHGHGTLVVSIDSTLGAAGTDRPGTLEHGELGALVAFLRSNREYSVLLFLSHHPPVLFPGAILPAEEPEYFARHFWVPGTLMQYELQKLGEARCRCLWLCGDVHYPDQVKFSGTEFVLGGRLGKGLDDARTLPFRQVSLIQFDGPTAPASVVRFVFKPAGTRDSHYGDWACERAALKEVVTRDPHREDVREAGAVSPVALGGGAQPPVMPTAVAGPTSVNSLGPELEVAVLDAVRLNSLYSLGRFSTSSRDASLAWIAIGPLLNTSALLASVLDAIATTISARFTGDSLRKLAFIGIDCWGGVLASLVASKLEVPCCVVAARGRGTFSTEFEKVSAGLLESLARAENVVFFADVIATGRTLEYVYSAIISRSAGTSGSEDRKFFGVALLFDPTQQRRAGLAFLSELWVACPDLRMPILPQESLPAEDLLPSRLTFRGHDSGGLRP